MKSLLLPLLLISCSALLLAYGQQQNFQWQIVNHIDNTFPQGVTILNAGPPQRPFARPAPRTIDPSLLVDFKDTFNLMQDVSATGDNLFNDISEQYVASIPSGFVEGEAGMFYDATGRVYHLPYMFHNRTNPTLPMPTKTPAQAAQQCTHRFPRLASVIQRYGHMYYHFIEETLPRVVLLQDAGALTSDTKILTWGKPYESAWLQDMGVNPDQLVAFDPEALYCADILLVPTPIPRITPPKEGLLAVRSALNVNVLPERQRDLIIYVSRASEPTRRVANEEQILKDIRATFASLKLVVFDGTLSPQDSIDLFKRARIVIGPHGAGLSHIVFSAPGTAVIEFLFMAEPPMMFWHTAAALGQAYWMLPVPNSYFMQREMQVPRAEVLDILTAVMSGPAPMGACKPGTAGRAGGLCTACPPGSYAFGENSKSCKLCAVGRVSSQFGNSYCSTCQPGTYSNEDGTECVPCPKGTFSVLAGASNSKEHCLTPEARRQRLEEQALSVEMLSKLSPVFATQIKRRRMLLGVEGSLTLSSAELCAARNALGSAAGPYLSGPYTIDPLLCPPATENNNTTQIGLPTPPTYGVVDTPTLPPTIPPIVVTPPPDDSVKGDPTVPQPPVDEEPPAVPAPQKKNIMDKWVIALIITATLMVLIPLLVCMGVWCVRRRRWGKQVARTPTVGAIPMPTSTVPGASGSLRASKAAKKASSGATATTFAVTNPVYDISALSTSNSRNESGSSKHNGR